MHACAYDVRVGRTTRCPTRVSSERISLSIVTVTRAASRYKTTLEKQRNDPHVHTVYTIVRCTNHDAFCSAGAREFLHLSAYFSPSNVRINRSTDRPDKLESLALDIS